MKINPHSFFCKWTLFCILLQPHYSQANVSIASTKTTNIQLNSHGYYYSKAEDRPELKKLINASLVKIFKTTLGREISRNILNCNLDAIQTHLGVDAKSAKEISIYCQHSDLDERVDQHNKYIYSSPIHALNKTTDSGVVGNQTQRTYSFIFTTDNNWTIDSWTNPATNNTSIIIPINEEESDLDESRLIEVLAHETAIYFDSKFWTGSAEFSKIPGAKDFLNMFKAPSHLISIGLDNPLIAHSLAYMRAFKVEMVITKELENSGQIAFKAKDSERRRQKIESLLSCRALCLHNFIKNKAEDSEKLSLPLIAYSPSYRTRLWRFIESGDLQVAHWPYSLETIQKLILELPSVFYRNHSKFSIHILLEVINSSKSDKKSSLAHEFEYLILNRVLPLHLKILEGQNQNQLIHSSALDYMAEPLLSGYNTRMSAGPRPRIVVGGF